MRVHGEVDRWIAQIASREKWCGWVGFRMARLYTNARTVDTPSFVGFTSYVQRTTAPDGHCSSPKIEYFAREQYNGSEEIRAMTKHG